MTKWRDWIETIGIADIVASLIFVGIELRQTRDITISEGNLANAELQMARNEAINEHASVWVRAAAGEALSREEVVIFENLVDSAAIHGFMEYARLERLGFAPAADSVAEDFALLLFRNAWARALWSERREFRDAVFSPAPGRDLWARAVLANLERLDAGS